MSLSIQVENVTQRFGATTALDSVRFSLEAGKIYGLLGRNGSGKSTLLSVIGAFRKPTDGTVKIDGEPVFENARITRQICLIREAGDTVGDGDPVGKALAFAASLRPDWDGDYADRLVKKFDLDCGKHLGDLSRGQRSALGVILGLASRAPLTMFDESYLGMDAPSRYLFYDELLADFIRFPRTIVLSTHLIEEVSSIFEEVVIIDRGKVLVHEQTERLLEQGASIVGSAAAVDSFTRDLKILSEKQLGPTKSVTVYGALDESRLGEARHEGIEIGPVALQDLFVFLTNSSGVAAE